MPRVHRGCTGAGQGCWGSPDRPFDFMKPDLATFIADCQINDTDPNAKKFPMYLDLDPDGDCRALRERLAKIVKKFEEMPP